MWSLSETEETHLSELVEDPARSYYLRLLAKAVLEVRETRSVQADLEFGKRLDTFQAGTDNLPSAADVYVIMSRPQYDTPLSAWWLTHPLVERVAEAASLQHDTVLEVFRALIGSGYALVKADELLISDPDGLAPARGNGEALIIERQANDLPAQVIAHVTPLGKVISANN